jgi:hypothetical protein
LATTLEHAKCFGILSQSGVTIHEAAVKTLCHRLDFDDPMVAIDRAGPVAILFEKRAEPLGDLQKMSVQPFAENQCPR